MREQRDFRRYLDLEHKAANDPDGRSPTTMDWIVGAKNLVVQGVRDFVRGPSGEPLAEKMTPRDFMAAMSDADATVRARAPSMRGG